MKAWVSARLTPRNAVALAVAIGALITALMAIAWYMAFLNRDLNVVASQFGPDLVVPLGLTPVGLIVAARQRHNPIGWLFLAAALDGAVHAASGEYAVRGLLNAVALPATDWAAWVSNWVLTLLFPAGILIFIFLLFPSGRLPSPRWRILSILAVAFTALALLITVPSDSPITPGPNVRAVASPVAIKGFSSTFLDNLGVIWLGGVVLLLIAGASLVVRYRRASGEERQQIKWFAYAVAITLIVYAATVPFSLAQTFNSGISNAAIEAGFGVALPVACGIAILRYRLYGIDVVISRTLVYGALAALITGVYVGIAVGFGELVGSGGKPNLGLSILATAIVAIGFQPARERLQRIANRLVYGKRATPYQVLSEFSSQVAGSYAADEVLPRMARVLEEGTGAERTTVWLRSGDSLHAAATWPLNNIEEPEPSIPMSDGSLPALPRVTRAVEVRHQGELLGALSVEKRRGESLTPVEEKLLDDLAHQAGLVLKNVGLTADLQRRLEELRLSRQRLVSAQDAERRKLERNLHDGAQQHLVAIKVKLGLAEMLAGKDPEKARATITQLKADTDEALETLRDLARGIYPPLLAEKGLPTALQSQARKATLPVTVEADGIGRYPQEVEATVYFCVLEALQNVQKYAQASHAVVHLREHDGALSFEVEDDGNGFDVETVRMGAGLTNMTDRLDAIDGTIVIRSARGTGTAIRGQVPAPVLTGAARSA
ncbi:MAG: histidine kinase [Candidatus Dormibacteria bacterium]